MKAIVNYIPNLNLILEYKTSISNSIKKNSIDRPGFSKILNILWFHPTQHKTSYYNKKVETIN